MIPVWVPVLIETFSTAWSQHILYEAVYINTRWTENTGQRKLFSVSHQNLQFHGVMRFYFEDCVEGNVATKCLRVCSNTSTREVIETLSEKFRPDMKMLTTCYSLYEIHTNKGNNWTSVQYLWSDWMCIVYIRKIYCSLFRAFL